MLKYTNFVGVQKTVLYFINLTPSNTIICSNNTNKKYYSLTMRNEMFFILSYN